MISCVASEPNKSSGALHSPKPSGGAGTGLSKQLVHDDNAFILSHSCGIMDTQI